MPWEWQVDWEPDHIGPQSRVPALPLVSLWEWPTWPRPSKWQKWALQAIIYIWNYILWQFAHLYLYHLITYSYMQCKEMLYRLLSLQTNLCISLHHQSDVLWHNGTNYEELLFSSDIWAWYILLQMSSWPDVVLLFASLLCNFILQQQNYWVTTKTRTTTTHIFSYLSLNRKCM